MEAAGAWAHLGPSEAGCRGAVFCLSLERRAIRNGTHFFSVAGAGMMCIISVHGERKPEPGREPAAGDQVAERANAHGR